MKKFISIMMGISVALLSACSSSQECKCFNVNADNGSKICKKATSPQRKIAVQMWSLHDVTLEDAINKLKPVGVNAIECYPGQKISNKYPNLRLKPGLTNEQIDFVKKLVADAGMKIVSFGVAQANNEKQIEQLCIFAKQLGANKVITEAPVITFPVWQKYCEKYDMYMCLHHHALDAPNQYYDAYVVNKYTAPYNRILANPDVGHLVRSNINAVCTIKMLKGNIGSIHIKDEDAFGNHYSKARVLGQGFVDIPNVLKELDKQGYDGYLVIEYEDDWGKNIPHIKACADYLKNN